MKKTSFLLFVVALFIATIAFSQEGEKNRMRFKLDLNLGSATFFDLSGPYTFFPTNYSNIGYTSIALGIKSKEFDGKAIGLDLAVDQYGFGDNIYSYGIRERNPLRNFKINGIAYKNITENLSWGLFVGAGLLHSKAEINVNNKTYKLDSRLGYALNLGLSMYYNFSGGFYFNAKINYLYGELQKAKLPKDLSGYESNLNSGRISGGYDFSLGLTCLF
ncbi:MAG: outer membrane beta-barrel protein [Bacteroidales bacterium]|jgi:hypothetical protein|nr:outer membrane beta-barrel protein [Bacteroidales bacterium]